MSRRARDVQVHHGLHDVPQKPSSCVTTSRALNLFFMVVAVGSLAYSSMKLQPCTCGAVGTAGYSASTQGKSRTLRLETGPNSAENRRIRLPRDVDRTAFSGSYWAHGSWGRIIRTSSGCWAYPTHDSYALECYKRLMEGRQEIFFDLEHLASLSAVEAQLLFTPVRHDVHSSSVPSPTPATPPTVTMGEVLKPKAESSKHSSHFNTSLKSEPFVTRRFHIEAHVCRSNTGTFNFTCIIKVNVRFDTITPASPPPEVCFITIGDWGEPRKYMKQVASMITEVAQMRFVKFVVSTGDNFYPSGVQSTADPQWIQTFEQPFSAPSVANVRWYISLGNHDQWGYPAQKTYSEDHPRWYLPEFSYSDSIPLYRDHAKVSNETIELMVFNSAGRDVTDQVAAGDRFFTSLDERHGKEKDRARHWRFVVNHEPIYSGGLHGLLPERNSYVRGTFQPILQQYMVHAYFNGDDHFLEVHRGFGTDFFTSGGGCGSDSYGTILRPTTKWNMFIDYLPKEVLNGEMQQQALDGAQTKSSSPRGAMMHCIDGEVMRTHVLDETGAVMYIHETMFQTNASEFGMEIEVSSHPV